MLEALLTGLPAIINKRPGDPVPELTDEICMLVENTPAGYGAALHRLISDNGARERLGRSALAHARSRWSPAVTEAKFVDIYRELLEGRPAVALQEAG
jgi:glycosyltransferase involved in cell wall biosynthesis